MKLTKEEKNLLRGKKIKEVFDALSDMFYTPPGAYDYDASYTDWDEVNNAWITNAFDLLRKLREAYNIPIATEDD